MTEERKHELRQLLQEAIENLEIRCRPEVRDQFRSIAVDEYRSHLQEHWATHSNSRDAALVDFNYNLHIVNKDIKSKLLDFLRVEFAAFIHEDKIQSASSFIHGGLPDGVPLNSLSNQLLKITLACGIEQAVSSFDKCTKETHGSFQIKALLEGISLKEEIQIFESMRLVPIRGTKLEYFRHLSGLPITATGRATFSLNRKTLLIIDCSISPIFYKPPEIIDENYLVSKDPAFRVEVNGENFSESKMDDFYARFCQALSLACNLAAQFSLTWKFLAEDELFNLSFGMCVIGDNPEIFGKPRFGSLIENEQTQVDEAKRLYEILVNLDSGVGEKLQISINRWIKSKAERNPVDKMIDLGIAFEALYLSGTESKNEIRFRFSLHAAWHLGERKEQRRTLMKEFKAIYDWRSAVVHTGKLPNKTKKTPFTQEEITKFIDKAQDLCRDSIMKILKEGKFPDWNDLILGKESL